MAVFLPSSSSTTVLGDMRAISDIIEELSSMQLTERVIDLESSATPSDSATVPQESIGTDVKIDDFTSIATKNRSKSTGAASLPGPLPEEKKKKLTVAAATKTIAVVKVVPNVHYDDIHGLIRLEGTESFISGSKDCSLKKWNVDGSLEATLKTIGARPNYLSWITALARVDADTWVHGQRDGIVQIWNNRGELLKTIDTASAHVTHVCKQRNLQRINCLAALPDAKSPKIYFGQPTSFSTFDIETNTYLNKCQTSSNDWVYAIHPLSGDKNLVVTGTKLQLWKKKFDQWKLDATFVEESGRRKKGKQRPFISALTLLEGSSDRFGMAVFDGSVRIYDIAARKLVFNQREHTGRVWTIENIERNLIASCSDDHTIKLWDTRRKKSVITLKEPLGRVSVLLNLGNGSLVSGSCPDDLTTATTYAQLTFWDIKKV